MTASIGDTRALRAFARTVELGSFSAAAAELGVKQSTVSKWLSALEEELGVRLIDRTTRSMRVTDGGQLFYRRVTAILADLETAVAEVRAEAADLRGRIRASVPVVFGRRFVAPLIAELLVQHDKLSIELVFSDRYVSLVEDGFDLAIRVGTPRDSSLQAHRLAGGRRRLVAAPAYLQTNGTPRTPKELESHQCLVHTSTADRTVWTLAKSKQTSRVRVGGRVSANHSEATLELALAGLGIALLASWLVDEPIARGELVELLPNFQPPPAPVHALTPPGRRLAPRVRALIEHLRDGLSGS